MSSAAPNRSSIPSHSLIANTAKTPQGPPRRLAGVWLGPCACALALALLGCGTDTEAPAAKAPEVLVVKVQQEDLQLFNEWVGTTEGMVNATIRPKISGYLIEQHYGDGDEVEEGQLLFTIDPRQYQATLDAAKGELEAAKAVLGKAEIDVKRYTPLAERGAVSQQELDDAIQARAAGRARVASAQAEVEGAQLNLRWTKIHSPISGIAGIATAQIGDLVNTLATLTTISQVDPIKVSFPISEIEYLTFRRQIIDLEASKTKRAPRSLTLTLADGSIYEHLGKVSVQGRGISETTGTIRIQGVFANPNNLLRPGQYAKVRAATESRAGALVIPQRAVSQMQGIDQVMVVDEQGKAKLRKVTLGPRQGTLWVIEEGVKVGDQVVVEGLQKIRNGMTVSAKPAPDPKAAKSQAGAPSKAGPDSAKPDAAKAQAGS